MKNLKHLATADSIALSHLEGPALDWLNATWIGYKGLFVIGGVMLLSLFSLRKIHVKS